MNLVSISVRILIRLAQNKSITLFILFSLMTVDLLLYFVIVFHSFFYLNCQKEISLHLIGVHAYACTSAHWLVRMDIQLTIFFWRFMTESDTLHTHFKSLFDWFFLVFANLQMRLCNFKIFSFTSSFNYAVYKNVTFGVIAITDSKPTALFRMDESSLSLF